MSEPEGYEGPPLTEILDEMRDRYKGDRSPASKDAVVGLYLIAATQQEALVSMMSALLKVKPDAIFLPEMQKAKDSIVLALETFSRSVTEMASYEDDGTDET